MRVSQFLVVAVAALLVKCGTVSCATDFSHSRHSHKILTKRSQTIDSIMIEGGGDRRLKGPAKKANEVNEERGITITDPVILENLAKFDDWVTKGKTAEKLYQELGLKLSWKIAYQTSRWKQFLFDEPEYLLFRKYVKYLQLTRTLAHYSEHFRQDPSSLSTTNGAGSRYFFRLPLLTAKYLNDAIDDLAMIYVHSFKLAVVQPSVLFCAASSIAEAVQSLYPFQ
ncbi:unnamed protein product [Phytophthora fragariaefolia]|uniref:RxLR effector protein n=1 Tax=Phytophthora fragariaefolia TaxID=1490495 RepID=A0A9W6XM70_9STRA|nr:unnamed protein product [Phytophthora fragariaefolia]